MGKSRSVMNASTTTFLTIELVNSLIYYAENIFIF